ncbi:MAG: hypothetical protein J6Z34_03640 [Clostridia bacterium]|nr:hypothetical protein [Clostridia bacterium]
MRTVSIFYYSPFGACENAAKKIGNEIGKSHPEMTVSLFSLTEAAERKFLERETISCDLLIAVFPLSETGGSWEIVEWLKKTAIKAAFASAVCVYGKGNPLPALRKTGYAFKLKNVPLVSAMDVSAGGTGRDNDFKKAPLFDAAAFTEGTMMNADTGKRIAVRSAALRAGNARIYL